MRRYDLSILAMTLLLVAIGLTSVTTASWFVATEDYKDPLHFLKRQGFSVAVGLGLMVMAARIPFSRMLDWAPRLYGATLVAMAMVWVPGISHRANGATRWFGIAGVTFQPAELAKVVVLICLAAWLRESKGRVNAPWVLVGAAVWIVPVLGLLLAQPDFGSTMIIGGLCTVMLVLVGLRLELMLLIGVLGAIGGVVLIAKEKYRIDRLASFLSPCVESAERGYQVCQSLVAMHNGGLLGTGLGNSQAKLLYLPEPHNDFIVAVIGEETGLWGIGLLMFSFALFAWRGLRVALRVTDPFAAAVAGTLVVMVVGQACLNLGVALSVLPPKGLVLPFISYGNSAMMMNLAGIGVLLSISADIPAEDPAAATQGNGTGQVQGAA